MDHFITLKTEKTALQVETHDITFHGTSRAAKSRRVISITTPTIKIQRKPIRSMLFTLLLVPPTSESKMLIHSSASAVHLQLVTRHLHLIEEAF